MATDRQIAANRRNALNSTGPRSVEGKAASSRNALKTGIYSQAIVIDGKENYEHLNELEAAFTAEYAPQTSTERVLVDSLIHYEWLLRRYRWLEADLWRAARERLDPRQTEHGNWAGHVFLDQPALSRLHRLQNQTQRLFHETLTQLRSAQSTRPEPVSESPEPTEPPPPEPRRLGRGLNALLSNREAAPNPQPPIGFVPSNPESREAATIPQPPAPSPQPPFSTLSLPTNNDRIDHGTL